NFVEGDSYVAQKHVVLAQPDPQTNPALGCRSRDPHQRYCDRRHLPSESFSVPRLHRLFCHEQHDGLHRPKQRLFPEPRNERAYLWHLSRPERRLRIKRGRRQDPVLPVAGERSAIYAGRWFDLSYWSGRYQLGGELRTDPHWHSAATESVQHKSL